MFWHLLDTKLSWVVFYTIITVKNNKTPKKKIYKLLNLTWTLMVEEGSVEAELRLVWAAAAVMAAGLMTWLDRVAMVPSVVMGVTKEAVEVSTVAPARLEETVPVTVPRVVTPRIWNKLGVINYIYCNSPNGESPIKTTFLPVVPFTTSVVTVGFTADTVTGVTSRTPPTVPMGTVRKIVPGCPGAPFKTTFKDKSQD